MGKDTVVIRSVVLSTTKQPFLSMPEKVKEYFCKNYGECEIIDHSSSFQGPHTRYVVVLQFDKGDIANRIKQKYNGRPLSGARVTTCWLDQKNMIELGITENMLRSEPTKSKGDSYGRAGSKSSWMQKYRGGGKWSNRDRGSSSSFRYGREPSRSPSPSLNYKTQASGHFEAVSSLHSLGLSSSQTEVSESQEHLTSGYSLKSGDFHERPSSQTSDHSSQSALTEESADRSLSQTSHGSRDSTSDRRRHVSSNETRSSSRLCARRRYESDSDDTSSKERDSNKIPRSSNYNSRSDGRRSRYSQHVERHRSRRPSGRFRDKSSESDSREKEKEEHGRRERWTRHQHYSRRSRASPRRRNREWSDDEKRSKQHDTSESDGQVRANPLSVLSQGDQGDNVPVCAETRSIEGTSQVQPMDLDTSLNSPQSSESQINIKEEVQQKYPAQPDQDSDDIDSHVDAQLESLFDSHQSKSQSHSSTVISDPNSSVFHFERDVTPPAEIVEATAEWYRTQNVAPNFNMIPLQHVLQYYQSSMTGGGNQKGTTWRNQSWPAVSPNQGVQEQQQQPVTDAFALSASATAEPNNTVNTAPDINLTAEQHTAMLESNPSPKSIGTKMAEKTDDFSFPTVQLGVPANKTKSRDDSSVSNKWTDSEVQQQLQMFLNKARLTAEEHSTTKPAPSSHLSSRENTVPSLAGVKVSSEGRSDNNEKWFNQRSTGISPYADMQTRPACHNIHEQTLQKSHLIIGSANHISLEHPACESPIEVVKSTESPQSSSSYSLEREIPEKIGSTLTFSHSPSTLHFPISQTTNPVLKKNSSHRYGPGQSYGMSQEFIQGQWKEQEKHMEQTVEGIWSEKRVPLSRESRNNAGEWVESTASRMQNSNSSWGGKVSRQTNDQLNPAHQAISLESSTCENNFHPSQLHSLGQLVGQNHQHNTFRIENEKLQLVDERTVNQLPAPRNQIEQEKFQEMLDRELEERALEEEKALGREPSYVVTASETENGQSVPNKISHDTQVDDKSTESITQSRAVEDSIQDDQAKEVQAALTTEKQVSHKYKQLQRSYYKEFCEQASILTESTKLLVCQNPDNKEILMASLQLSLEKLSLHLKEQFWYQVELGVE